MIARSVYVLLLLALIPRPIRAQSACSHSPSAGGKEPAFVVRSGSITLPVGFFLLMRRGVSVGAIRLTSASTSGPDNWFGTSSYESLFQRDPAYSLSSPSAVRHASPMTFSPTKGVHAVFLYGGGHHTAHIGPWTFDFDNPVLLPMTDLQFWSGEMSDHGLEFAPTSACDPSEIDEHDLHLHWYRFDRNAQFSLPIAGLPRRESAKLIEGK